MRTGTILADRYQLDDPIAAGGVGQVWRATDLVLQRPIAIKLLRPEYADHHETLSRFRAEARHAGSLAHPGIAQVYDFGDNPAEGPPYLVMELVDGPSLADVLATEPVTPAYALEVLAKAATGLAAAHEAGLVHRDIKPGNILLGRDGQVKITDFGIAHAVGSAPVTDPGLVMGTTQYLAPERIAGGSGTPAADLYSLGIVMHECLSGVPPYEGTPAEVMAGHLYVPLPPLPAGTPPEVTDLVARLTAKDPEQRITDADELAALAQAVHSSITGGPMPRQRQAPAVSPASGVAAPPFADPARMPRTGDHQVPHTGDMVLDPSLTVLSTGEHPYADQPVVTSGLAAAGLSAEPETVAGPDDDVPVVGGFRVDAPDVPGTEVALREPADGHGTVAIPPPGTPDPVRETSVDLGSADVPDAARPGIDETSVDLMGVSHIQAGASDSPGARTTSVDLATLEAAGAAGSGSPPESSTDPFAMEGASSGGYARPRLEGMPPARRPRSRRRAAVGVGVVLLAGGGLAGVAASGMLHASPAADRTNSRTSHQPLSAVQPNAGSPSASAAKTAGAKPGKHGKAYAAKHAKTASPTPPPAPATSAAPVQEQTSSGSSSPSGGSSPSAPASPKPQPKPGQSTPVCILGVLCSS